jgi:hypothetical protein
MYFLPSLVNILSLCVGPATRCLQLWNLAVVAVLFGELLDSPAANLELSSDQSGIHFVIGSSLRDLGVIVLFKLHLMARRGDNTDKIFGGHYMLLLSPTLNK